MDSHAIQRMPTGVLEQILSKTSPRDVRNLSSVSKTFNAAACDDLVWKAFLPPNAKEIAENVHGEPLSYESLKALYYCFCSHLLLGDGTEGFWVDPDTGRVCRSFSARTLKVTWGDTPRYWEWGPHEGSRFQEVAKLKSVCWLELTGEINTKLPPGVYTFSWVLKVEEKHYGMNELVTFGTTDALGVSEEEKKFVIKPKQSNAENSSDESSNLWFMYNVRHFTVERVCNGDANSMGEVSISFFLREIQRLNWKSGLLVDGVVIRAGEYDLEKNGTERDVSTRRFR